MEVELDHLAAVALGHPQYLRRLVDAD
jgi:hypothetical protein